MDRQVSISTLKGAFRFMSGRSPKEVYRVTTPTATIGISRLTRETTDDSPRGSR